MNMNTINDQQNKIKQKFRHHLDDSQVRQALVNPYARLSPQKLKPNNKINESR